MPSIQAIDLFIEAARSGNIEGLKSGLRRGVPINSRNSAGWSALIAAASNNHPHTIQFLLDKKAAINAYNIDQETALMRAACKGHAKVVSILLAARANKNVQSKTGMTALMLAVLAGHLKIVDDLLKAGARRDIQNVQGKTALDLARESGNAEMIELFTLPPYVALSTPPVVIPFGVAVPVFSPYVTRAELDDQLKGYAPIAMVSEAARGNESKRRIGLEERYIAERPALSAYCNMLGNLLKSHFTANMVIDTGRVENSQTNELQGYVKSAVEALDRIAQSFPVFGHATAALAYVTNQWISLDQSNRVVRVLDLIPDETKLSKVARHIARTFSIAFEEEIMGLSDDRPSPLIPWLNALQDKIKSKLKLERCKTPAQKEAFIHAGIIMGKAEQGRLDADTFNSDRVLGAVREALSEAFYDRFRAKRSAIWAGQSLEAEPTVRTPGPCSPTETGGFELSLSGLFGPAEFEPAESGFDGSQFNFADAVKLIKALSDEARQHLAERGSFWHPFRKSIAYQLQLAAESELEPKQVSGSVIRKVLAQYKLGEAISSETLAARLESLRGSAVLIPARLVAQAPFMLQGSLLPAPETVALVGNCGCFGR